MASRSLLNYLLRQPSHVIKHNCKYLHPEQRVYQRHYSETAQKLTVVEQSVEEDTQLNHELVLKPFTRLTEQQKVFVDNLKPPLKRSFNLAAYVNSSTTLQELVKLGVSLFDIENIDIEAAKRLVLLDFQSDCVPYIRFLVHHGLKHHNLGRFISEFPRIFQVPIEDLETRIQYLKMKRFTSSQIAHALNRSSQVIAHKVKSIDHQLGQLQIEFDLPGQAIRNIVSKYPPVIALPKHQHKLTNFTLKEEFGFETAEITHILEQQPKVLDILRPVLIERLELIHNTIGLSHKTIVKFPKLITGPIFDIRNRSMYLKKLNRDQYDPSKPLYVPPSALYNGSDEKFCKLFTKTNINDFKLYVKSL